MIVESVAANAAILFGLALILGVFAPRIASGKLAWGAGIVVLTLASWLQLAAPAPLANQIGGMGVAWGLWVMVSSRLASRASAASDFTDHFRPTPDEAPTDVFAPALYAEAAGLYRELEALTVTGVAPAGR